MSPVLSAQQQREGRPRFSRVQLQEQKRAYLTKALELTEDEAQKLQEVLSELDNERFKLWQSLHEVRRRLRQGETLSDTEYSDYLERVLTNRIKEAELERQYYNRCKGIIPIGKLVRLESLSRDFAKQFVRNRPRKVD